MQQRMLVASALLLSPGLILADEPTTALDVTIQAQILRLLLEVRDEFGTAIFFVTHDLAAVAEICDRVLVMYAGHIVEAAPVRELFSRAAAPVHARAHGVRAAPVGGARRHPDRDRGGAARSRVLAARLPVRGEMRAAREVGRARTSAPPWIRRWRPSAPITRRRVTSRSGRTRWTRSRRRSTRRSRRPPRRPRRASSTTSARHRSTRSSVPPGVESEGTTR